MVPLMFEPVFKSMLWGGRRLPQFLNVAVEGDAPIGEAWVLSDVAGSESRIVNGEFAGKTLNELLTTHRQSILGDVEAPEGRFPLLLKFIDARRELSVQVHPNDEQAAARVADGRGKTEAWVVLDRDLETSRIYAGFREGMTAELFHAAMQTGSVPDTLHSFVPEVGDCLFLEAGTVHAIGADLFIFEVQQTSDITYRLYDWDRVDAATGLPRQMHLKEGLECSRFDRGPCEPVSPLREGDRERLVHCDYFSLHHSHQMEPFRIGKVGECRIAVTIQGTGTMRWSDTTLSLRPGSVVLLPASVGEVECVPEPELRILECGVPPHPQPLSPKGRGK